MGNAYKGLGPIERLLFLSLHSPHTNSLAGH